MTRDDTADGVDHEGSITLDKRELTILRALISDGTSTTAARILGLSERHTRRLLRSLEARLGVDNTHALIAVTVAAGLIGAPPKQLSSALRPVRSQNFLSFPATTRNHRTHTGMRMMSHPAESED